MAQSTSMDAEQHSIGKIIIWGTVDDGKRKRSFQCDYTTRITGFRLRDMRRRLNPEPHESSRDS